MKTLKNYQPHQLFYTGLYSTKALSIIKQCLKNLKNQDFQVFQDPSHEIVVAYPYNHLYTHWYDTITINTSPAEIKKRLITAFCQELTMQKADSPKSVDYKNKVYVLQKYFLGEPLTSSAEALFEKLRGIQLDVITTELNSIRDSEEHNIQTECSEYLNEISAEFNKYDFPSIASILGQSQHWPRKQNKTFGINADSEYADKAKIEKIAELEKTLVETNNQLADMFDEYERLRVLYIDMKRDLVKSVKKNRDDKIKAMKKEFRDIKRTSKKTTA